jgi:hypothetical protein
LVSAHLGSELEDRPPLQTSLSIHPLRPPKEFSSWTIKTCPGRNHSWGRGEGFCYVPDEVISKSRLLAVLSAAEEFAPHNSDGIFSLTYLE